MVEGALGQRAGSGRVTEIAQDHGEVVQASCRPRGVRDRRRFRRWPGRARPAGARRPVTEIAQDPGEVSQRVADVGVFGPVGGFMTARCAFGRCGRRDRPEPPGSCEVVQLSADVGVVGTVRAFGDGQCAFGERTGDGSPSGPQVHARLPMPATSGWSAIVNSFAACQSASSGRAWRRLGLQIGAGAVEQPDVRGDAGLVLSSTALTACSTCGNSAAHRRPTGTFVPDAPARPTLSAADVHHR